MQLYVESISEFKAIANIRVMFLGVFKEELKKSLIFKKTIIKSRGHVPTIERAMHSHIILITIVSGILRFLVHRVESSTRYKK